MVSMQVANLHGSPKDAFGPYGNQMLRPGLRRRKAGWESVFLRGNPENEPRVAVKRGRK